VSTRTTFNTSLIKGTMTSSRCVIIKPRQTLKQLQKKLCDGGFALGELLLVDFPDVDAVLAAVEKIEFLLQDHPMSICDQWVTAHVMVGRKKKFISSTLVREVSKLLLLLCFYCA
jgi:hypothetical protein